MTSEAEQRARDSLLAFIPMLRTRNAALLDVSRAGLEMRAVLERDASPDIGSALLLRDGYCQRLGESAISPEIESEMLRLAEDVSDSGGANAELAREALHLRDESKRLAEAIVECQSRCEEILRNRIELARRAIGRSARRRDLDGAYGPACGRASSSYLDRRQ